MKINAKNKGDGLQLLRGLKQGSAAIVFFDPQYRANLDKLNYGNEGARQKGRAKLVQMDGAKIVRFINLINRALKPSGHLFLWVDTFLLASGGHLGMISSAPELCIVDLITWDKQRMGMGYRSRRQSEHLLVIQKKPLRAKGVWRSHDIRDNWPELVPGKRGIREFTHAKPVGLQTALIECVADSGELVIDPAAGSYSVLTACQNSFVPVKFLGCDLRG